MATNGPAHGPGQGPKSQTILLVGGIAGITAALEAVMTGHDAVLLERGPSPGGRVALLARHFPKLCRTAAWGQRPSGGA